MVSCDRLMQQEGRTMSTALQILFSLFLIAVTLLNLPLADIGNWEALSNLPTFAKWMIAMRVATLGLAVYSIVLAVRTHLVVRDTKKLMLKLDRIRFDGWGR
jgi:hypothetical protein